MPVHREAKLILAHSTHTSSFTKNQRSQISKHSNYRKLLIWFQLENYPAICCCRQTDISPEGWYPAQELLLQASTQPSNLQRMYVVSNPFRQFPDKFALEKCWTCCTATTLSACSSSGIGIGWRCCWDKSFWSSIHCRGGRRFRRNGSK